MLFGMLRKISKDSYSVVNVRGGDERTRTADPLLAKQMLSQLSYIPAHGLQSMLIAVAHAPPPSACGTSSVRGRYSRP